MTRKFASSIEEVKLRIESDEASRVELATENEQFEYRSSPVRRELFLILRYRFRQKLKNLLEQYELREQHVEAIVKSRELELQLEQAKHNQQVLVTEELTKQVLFLLGYRFTA